MLEPGGKARFLAIADPAGSVLRIERDVHLGPTESFEVKETARFAGVQASFVRRFLQDIEPGRRREALGHAMSRDGNGVELRSLAVKNLERPSEPLVLEMTYDTHEKLKHAAEQLLGQLPTGWERDRVSPPRLDRRETPLLLRWPLHVTTESVFHVPPGFTLGPLRPPAGETGEIARWSVNAEEHDGQARVRFSFDRGAGRFPASAYTAYSQGAELALGALEQELVLRPRERGPRAESATIVPAP